MATIELFCHRPWRTPRWLAMVSMSNPLVDLESETVSAKWHEWVPLTVPSGENSIDVSYLGGGGYTMSRAKITLDLEPEEVVHLEYRCSLIWLRKGTLHRVGGRDSL